MIAKLYYHIAIMGHWRSVVREQAAVMSRAGIEGVNIGFAGGGDAEIHDAMAILSSQGVAGSIVARGGLSDYEYPTLRALWAEARTGRSDALGYVHTKGVSKHPTQCSRWRQIMNAAILHHWRDCVEKIRQGADCCGTSHPEGGAHGLAEPFGRHYQGNFWWVSSAAASLAPDPESLRSRLPNGTPVPDELDRLMAEMWLASCCNGRWTSILQEHIPLMGSRAAAAVDTKPSLQAMLRKGRAEKTVTVSIMSYHYGHLAAHAIESVLSQTARPDVVRLIDDGVGDCSHLPALYPEVEIVQRPSNLGRAASFQDALMRMDTDFGLHLGADNWLRPDTIRRCLDHADYDIVGYHIALTGDLAGGIARAVKAEQVGSGYSIWRFRPRDINQGNFLHGSSLFDVRKAKATPRGYAGAKEEDWGMWRQMIAAGASSCIIPEPMLYYRRHRVNFNPC